MGIDAAIDWARRIAQDDTHGYSQAQRWGKDFDCSSYVISALEAGGFPMRAHGATYTGNMAQALKACGFRRVNENARVNLATGAGLVAGDVLLNPATHTELYIGNGLCAGAHSSETGGKYGAVGDQTGNEISIQPYRNKNYTEVWRYLGAGAPPVAHTSGDQIGSVARAVIRGEYGNGAERVRRLIAAGYDADKVQQRVNQIMRGG